MLLRFLDWFIQRISILTQVFKPLNVITFEDGSRVELQHKCVECGRLLKPSKYSIHGLGYTIYCCSSVQYIDFKLNKLVWRTVYSKSYIIFISYNDNRSTIYSAADRDKELGIISTPKNLNSKNAESCIKANLLLQ